MTLFDHVREKLIEKEQPLAARMRPRTLDEFVGQEHILAPGRLLRRAIRADRVSSLILYGPPGTGKTTLASVIANTTESRFSVLNAVLSGVKNIRSITEEAKRLRGEYGKRTILFVDEVHRWNKAQQDALLPWVENGTVILIGATTENPYFTVNRALASRSRIFQLKPLRRESLRRILESALEDPERGYGSQNIILEEEAAAHLVDVANGDARAVLNAIELAVETTLPDEERGSKTITLEVAEESIQRRAVLYDKEGDYHFDTISAFIKSLRGSDPDAAMYWLAKMVYAGEDPRFLFRRMLIFCCEDVGLADPNALTVVNAAADAFERVGMPEGRYQLGMAALYLATAPKSNSVFAFFDALAAVEKESDGSVPNHLKDPSRDKEGFGHGTGYLYPHAYRDHWVAQQYLPDSMQGRLFYQPGKIGHEKQISDKIRRRRETQLAAALEKNSAGAPPEILTFSPKDDQFERWLARTLSGVGDHLADVRDRVFQPATCQRHWRILDLNAGNGLLTWEALRKVPEGGVWSLVSDKSDADTLAGQVEQCPDMRRPKVMVGSITRLKELVSDAGSEQLRFELIIARNALGPKKDKQTILEQIRDLLEKDGILSLAEVVPQKCQRLYKLVDTSPLGPELADKLCSAEETIYANPTDPMVNWNPENLQDMISKSGLEICHAESLTHCLQQRISPEMIAGWFTARENDKRPAYCQRLAEQLSPKEITKVRELYTRGLENKNVPWSLTVALVAARKHKTRNAGTPGMAKAAKRVPPG